MSKIFIFSGTTEGRLLSEHLCLQGLENTVFVATEYGQVVMKDHDLCHIRQGRLSYEAMVALFEKELPDIVVDATHPFATEVSANIRTACGKAGLNESYTRLARHLFDLDEESLPTAKIKIVASTDEAINYLKKKEGNILLTTGVKTLSQYAACSELKDRLFARILPSMESFCKAVETGLDRRQIIAMEGPFSKEMNEATMAQFNINILVTKNSGIRGGIKEKLSACQDRDVEAVVIDLEEKYKNDGYSLDEVEAIIYKKYTHVNKRISIVGIGMGDDASITVAGKEAVKGADLLIGASRMLDYGRKINPTAKLIAEYRSEAILDFVKESVAQDIVILMSGDTGFYSGADKLTSLLDKSGMVYRLYPGISSISYLCACTGLRYSDYPLLSAHGRSLEVGDTLDLYGGFFAILSGYEDIEDILQQLQDYPEAIVYVAYNLGQPDQKIVHFKLGSPQHFDKKGLYVLGAFLDENN